MYRENEGGEGEVEKRRAVRKENGEDCQETKGKFGEILRGKKKEKGKNNKIDKRIKGKTQKDKGKYV